MLWTGAAYFDGSCGADQFVMAVAGGVSSVDNWIDFEKEWLDTLALNNVQPPFHMKEFTRSRDGLFEGWNNERRVGLMTPRDSNPSPRVSAQI